MGEVDYSLVARPYALLECLVFRRDLQQARVAHLSYLMKSLKSVEKPRVLLVGDGDGRFLEEILKNIGSIEVDYVDCSAGMLEVAKHRVSDDSRVSWYCCDFEDFTGAGYDFISFHFFLDRFDSEERSRLIVQAGGMLKPRARVLVSDFDPSISRSKKPLLLLMQWFFRVFASSPIVEVARSDTKFECSGFELEREMSWQGGWIYSHIWKLVVTDPSMQKSD